MDWLQAPSRACRPRTFVRNSIGQKKIFGKPRHPGDQRRRTRRQRLCGFPLRSPHPARIQWRRMTTEGALPPIARTMRSSLVGERVRDTPDCRLREPGTVRVGTEIGFGVSHRIGCDCVCASGSDDVVGTRGELGAHLGRSDAVDGSGLFAHCPRSMGESRPHVTEP